MVIVASYYEKKEFELQKLKDDENKKSQPKVKSDKLYRTWWEQMLDILKEGKEHGDFST